MTTLIIILLEAPAVLAKGKTPMEMYSDSGIAIVAFITFLLLLYLILSPDKTKKSRIRSK
jgi:hypothetical protein